MQSAVSAPDCVAVGQMFGNKGGKCMEVDPIWHEMEREKKTADSISAREKKESTRGGKNACLPGLMYNVSRLLYIHIYSTLHFPNAIANTEHGIGVSTRNRSKKLLGSSMSYHGESSCVPPALTSGANHRELCARAQAACRGGIIPRTGGDSHPLESNSIRLYIFVLAFLSGFAIIVRNPPSVVN